MSRKIFVQIFENESSLVDSLPHTSEHPCRNCLSIIQNSLSLKGVEIGEEQPGVPTLLLLWRCCQQRPILCRYHNVDWRFCPLLEEMLNSFFNVGSSDLSSVEKYNVRLTSME
ncbi:hypothetical protein ACFE04_021822 [Oxalis oulophora]